MPFVLSVWRRASREQNKGRVMMPFVGKSAGAMGESLIGDVQLC